MKTKLSVWRIRLELAFVHAVLFFLRGAGYSGPPHGLCDFFVDRYLRLYQHHQSRGKRKRAKRFLAKAEKFWFMGSPNEPPPSVAPAMPVPVPPLSTWAVAGRKDPERYRNVA